MTLKIIKFRRKGSPGVAVCRGEKPTCNLLPKIRMKRGPCGDCITCAPGESRESFIERVTRETGGASAL